MSAFKVASHCISRQSSEPAISSDLLRVTPESLAERQPVPRREVFPARLLEGRFLFISQREHGQRAGQVARLLDALPRKPRLPVPSKGIRSPIRTPSPASSYDLVAHRPRCRALKSSQEPNQAQTCRRQLPQAQPRGELRSLHHQHFRIHS